MIEVSPLVGPDSLRACAAFHKLLLMYKMLPLYIEMGFKEFFDSVAEKSESEQETIVRQCLALNELTDPEIFALMRFTKDKNGVPYSPVNIKNLGLKDLHEHLVAVCMRIAQIKVDLVTPEEKKN